MPKSYWDFSFCSLRAGQAGEKSCVCQMGQQRSRVVWRKAGKGLKCLITKRGDGLYCVEIRVALLEKTQTTRLASFRL